MKHSLKTGFSFGVTSAIITTLGLIVGLNSSTHSLKVVISGILSIAIADAFSDAMGIHMAEEAENVHTTLEIWEATLSTFFTKFIFTLIFIIPFLLFSMSTSILICIGWSFLIIMLGSIYITREQGIKSYRPVFEHLFIAVVVIIVTYYVGNWIAKFGK